MNIWILKYGKSGFSSNFVDEAQNLATTIEQLKFSEINQKKLGHFHFISITTQFEKSQKEYIEDSDGIVRGYSGLVIGKNEVDIDYRDIANINCDNPERYSGQFCLFTLNNDSFVCKTDNMGFHKVFYFKDGDDVYVTNYIKLLEITGKIMPDPEQLLLDFLTSRYGVSPGYNTLFKGVYNLPEFGFITISSNKVNISTYQSIETLLNPATDFETNLNQTVNEFRNAANYLRNFHKTTIGLSGGFDGRLILSFFYKTSGKSLETFTYNRAGKLDLWIARYLSNKFSIPHKKFIVVSEIKNFKPEVKPYKDSSGDPFTIAYNKVMGSYFKTTDSFKVNLPGNGGDIDSELGKKKLKALKNSDFKSFIMSYSQMLVEYPHLSDEFKTKSATTLSDYFCKKYSAFEANDNYLQLLLSSLFHFERFGRDQSFAFSQKAINDKDVFAPFTSESFIKTVFKASKKQLQRNLKAGIHYQLYYRLTKGTVPYAPVLTARNDFGKNIIQKMINYIVPILPKIIWKLNGGDTNQKMRNQYSKMNDDIVKEFLIKNSDSDLWQYINYKQILDGLSNDYKGQYNQIALIVKSLENNTK